MTDAYDSAIEELFEEECLTKNLIIDSESEY